MSSEHVICVGLTLSGQTNKNFKSTQSVIKILLVMITNAYICSYKSIFPCSDNLSGLHIFMVYIQIQVTNQDDNFDSDEHLVSF